MMSDMLLGTYKGKQYRLKVDCYSKTPAIKVQLIPTDGSDRITVTQNIGQGLPRYQAYLGEDILDVDSFEFMAFMEKNNLGHIVDYKRYARDPLSGETRKIAALFQFHSSALRRFHAAGCTRYESRYAKLKRAYAERRTHRMAG